MFASATSGDRPNNSKFSSCSIANISSVLDAIQDNKKRNCFKGLYAIFFFSVFVLTDGAAVTAFAILPRRRIKIIIIINLSTKIKY